MTRTIFVCQKCGYMSADGRRDNATDLACGGCDMQAVEVVSRDVADDLATALQVFASIADRIDSWDSPGAGSPLYAVREECEAARTVLAKYREAVDL
jgi:hypothetical protein